MFFSFSTIRFKAPSVSIILQAFPMLAITECSNSKLGAKIYIRADTNNAITITFIHFFCTLKNI